MLEHRVGTQEEWHTEREALLAKEKETKLRPTGILLLAAAAIAWLVTVNRMHGMDMGPGTDLGGLGWFAGVWAVMMAAMMLPSLAPMADAYAGQARAASETRAPRSQMQTTVFVGGYLLAWVLVGLAAWTLVKEVRSFDAGFLDWANGGRYVAGAIIAAAGVYELTPMKARSLRHCRDRGLLVAGWHRGPFGAARMGLAQGAHCIGCSWALMAALFALGVMSITWMVVVAVLVAMEKLLPRPALTSRAAATVLLALAVGMALAPETLPGPTIPG